MRVPGTGRPCRRQRLRRPGAVLLRREPAELKLPRRCVHSSDGRGGRRTKCAHLTVESSSLLRAPSTCVVATLLSGSGRRQAGRGRLIGSLTTTSDDEDEASGSGGRDRRPDPRARRHKSASPEELRRKIADGRGLEPFPARGSWCPGRRPPAWHRSSSCACSRPSRPSRPGGPPGSRSRIGLVAWHHSFAATQPRRHAGPTRPILAVKPGAREKSERNG